MAFLLLWCIWSQKGQIFSLKLVKVSAPDKSTFLFWLVRFGNKKIPLAWKELLSVMEVGLFSEVHFLSTVLPAVSLDTLFAHSHGCALLWWNPSICHRVKLYSAEKVNSSATGLNTKYSGKLNAFVSTSLNALKATLIMAENYPLHKMNKWTTCVEKFFKTSCLYFILRRNKRKCNKRPGW